MREGYGRQSAARSGRRRLSRRHRQVRGLRERAVSHRQLGMNNKGGREQ
jgi:hypothetical protein